MRTLDPTLDQLQLLSQERRPAFLIEVYDLRSTEGAAAPTKINDVVLFNQGGPPLPAIVGPRDFTADVDQVRVTERAGDFVGSAIAASSIAFQVQDPSAELDPRSNPPTSGSPQALGRWLRQGNAVVLREGDTQVDQSRWPITFTGLIVGQPGQNRNRTTEQSFLTVEAVGREQQFLRQASTSRNFVQNTTYRDMVEDIAQSDMGLDLDELDLPVSFGNTITCQVSTQFVEQSPLVSIAQILFTEGQLPRFQGDGRLGLIDGLVTKGPARVYTSDQLVTEVTRPVVKENGPNVVIVVGLSCDMTEVVQDRQELATATITTGFFASDTDIPVFWSDDRTQQAKNTRLEVIHSIGSGLLQFGSESYSEDTQADGNAVGGTIKVEGGLNWGILAIIGGTWLASHNIPDIAPSGGGATIPVGRLVEGAVGKILFSAISTQARGQYAITGEPIEYVFEEIRAEAVTGAVNLGTEERREVEIQNALISTQADGDSAALRVLTRERKKQNARQVRMVHDLALEPDDIFQSSDGTQMMVSQVSRTLQRGGTHEAVLECFEVTPGVRP